jgi:hypothetical protein
MARVSGRSSGSGSNACSDAPDRAPIKRAVFEAAWLSRYAWQHFMRTLFDSFWRAMMYCMHPRVIVLSILPVIFMGALALVLGRLYWAGAVTEVRGSLESYELFKAVGAWLQDTGMGGLQLFLAPAVVLFLAIPVLVMVTLLAVGLFMTPAMVTLVASRRFPDLARKEGVSRLASLGWSLGSTGLTVMMLLASTPLWLVPPLVLILPPMIWGWLICRVMAFDALADHASAQERRQILLEHQGPLLMIGVLSGYLGTVPSLLWASSAMLATLAPLLVPAAIWLYTLVFAFSSLWFVHYCLTALEQLRKKGVAPAQPPAKPPAQLPVPPPAAPPAPPAPAAAPPAAPPPPKESLVPPAAKPDAAP